MSTLAATNFTFPGQTKFYKGKVRDVYTIDNKYLVMIVSDRISAFDVVLPKAIPYKGQVLNQLAAYFMQATADLVPNWIIDVPDPSVTIGKMCQPFRVEMVIRGYLAGHAWRTYKLGERMLCGVRMPDGLKEIGTPSAAFAAGTKGSLPTRRPTPRQDSLSSSPFKEWQAVTHALQPEHLSMSTSKANCWPAFGCDGGISSR